MNKFTELKCKECGATLNLDLNNLIAYCPYCGAKLLFEVDDINQIILAKEETTRQKMKYEHEMEMKLFEEHERKEKIQEEKEEQKSSFKTIAIIALVTSVFLYIVAHLPN